MIEIDDNIVSEDILTTKFLCDLTACRGACCVEGNAGAPLELDEVDTLEEHYDEYNKYMTERGREVIAGIGFVTVDSEGDLTTPLIDDAQCAFAYTENGITKCAVERAYLNGECSFRKPISCHLYPIRLVNFSNGTVGLNLHRWEVCKAAFELGEAKGTAAYKMLREPIIRRFGEEFYEALEAAEEYLKTHE